MIIKVSRLVSNSSFCSRKTSNQV